MWKTTISQPTILKHNLESRQTSIFIWTLQSWILQFKKLQLRTSNYRSCQQLDCSEITFWEIILWERTLLFLQLQSQSINFGSHHSFICMEDIIWKSTLWTLQYRATDCGFCQPLNCWRNYNLGHYYLAGYNFETRILDVANYSVACQPQYGGVQSLEIHSRLNGFGFCQPVSLLEPTFWRVSV